MYTIEQQARLEALEQRARLRSELPPPATRRALRQAAGVSLADVAAVVGVTRQAVHLWESGARTPRRANLKTYVDVLRVFRQSGTS